VVELIEWCSIFQSSIGCDGVMAADGVRFVPTTFFLTTKIS